MDRKSVKKRIQRYIDDVLSGQRTAGRLERLAVLRHMNDLEDAGNRGFYFDEDAGFHVIEFFGFLKHSKGEWAGETFELEPWQMFTMWVLFGWKRQSDGLRRFHVAYKSMARKNGKSQEAAGVGHYCFVADGEHGAEVYTAATKLDQAKIIHEEAKRMVRSSPFLSELIRVLKSNLSIDMTNSKYEPLGADAKTLDGLNVSAAIIDELHAHPSRELWDVLETATSSRRQPLMYAITTAGMDRTSFCWQQDSYAIKVLEGVINDDSFFAFICRPDEGDDWKNEATWKKANPNLGISVKIDDLRRKCHKAQNMPTALDAFLRLHLNMWTEKEQSWIRVDEWNKCAGESDMDELDGQPCVCGFDLSSTRDITALVLLFDIPGGKKAVKPYFWIPRDTARARQEEDHVPYVTWAREGLIELTEGNVVDQDFVRRRINEINRTHQVREIAIDRWNSTQLQTQLMGDGFEIVQFGQGFASMTAPTKELDRLVASQSLVHYGNPVLTWMASNVILEKDAAGNIKPSKSKSREKIDGIVALIMAIGRAMVSVPKGASIYETRGLLTL